MAFKSQNHEELIKLLQVSRETIRSLNVYEGLLLENNRKFNLISKSTENILKTRHILDSAQVIDFIDKNSKICADLGTGAGFPGIVLSILFKERKCPIRINLYEKSAKKCQFLSKVVKKLNLNAVVLEKNVFEQKNLEVDAIVARAFKPIQSIFKIVTENFKNYKNLIIPQNIDYDLLSGLSNEVKSKFKQIKPKTMGQALRIDGITPAAVYILLSFVKRKSLRKTA